MVSGEQLLLGDWTLGSNSYLQQSGWSAIIHNFSCLCLSSYPGALGLSIPTLLSLTWFLGIWAQLIIFVGQALLLTEPPHSHTSSF